MGLLRFLAFTRILFTKFRHFCLKGQRFYSQIGQIVKSKDQDRASLRVNHSFSGSRGTWSQTVPMSSWRSRAVPNHAAWSVARAFFAPRVHCILQYLLERFEFAIDRSSSYGPAFISIGSELRSAMGVLCVTSLWE